MRKYVWAAKDYLDQYFPEDKVSEDEVGILKFIINFLKNSKQGFSKMLDFGAGPTIHRLIPIVPYVKEIYISEYLSESVREINLWLKNNKRGRNWDFYIKNVLRLERRKTDNKSVEDRANLLRKKIWKIWKGDIFKKFPLNKKVTFPLVTSFYCLDAVTSSKKIWRQLMRNLSTLVEPGGWLILSASRNTNFSMLAGKKMKNVKLDKKYIREFLPKIGYAESSIDIKVIPAKMWADVGISSILIVSAQKKKKWKI